nr:hypothetical protein [Burkholderia pseudomallei]
MRRSCSKGYAGGRRAARRRGRRVGGSAGRRVGGSAVQRFSGSAVQRFSGSAVQQFSSSAVQQFSSSAVQQFSSSAVRRTHRTARPPVVGHRSLAIGRRYRYRHRLRRDARSPIAPRHATSRSRFADGNGRHRA